MWINPRGKTLRHLDRIVAWQHGSQPAPVTVEWDLSNRCVLGCQDCHFAHTHTRGPWAVKDRILPVAYDGTGDLADADLVRRALDEMVAAGVRSIVWSGGGEPTTHPDWLDLAEYAAGVGLDQGLYTCGGLLTERSGRRAARVMAWVVVSLDAADADTYAAEKGVAPVRFAAACAGLSALVGHGAVVGASFLLHAQNVHRIDDMLALGRRLGASYVTFRPAIRTSPDRPAHCLDDRQWILDHLAMFEALALEPDVEIDPGRFERYAGWQGHGYTDCHGITLHTTVTPDGRVWICPQRRGVTPIGDLSRESFAAVWARHPKSFHVDEGCRVLCRLHPINETLAALRTPIVHEAFL